MEGVVRLLIEVAQFLWPFRPVDAWERGFYYVFGRPRWRVGPGIYPVVPYFTDVRAVSVVPEVVSSPLLTITLKDGQTLTFSISATVRVHDVIKAVVDVDNYRETIQELISAISAEKLAEVEASRVEPTKRKALLNDLRRWVDEQTSVFGVSVDALRFSNFMLNARTYRLLSDTALGGLKASP